MTWYLTRSQDRLVVAVSRRLCAASDRRPFFAALRKLLPKRPVTNKELHVALDAALKKETTGWKDGEGLIPRIRPTMPAAEASVIYSRGCAVELPDSHRPVELNMTPQEAAALYETTLVNYPGYRAAPVADRGDDRGPDRRANLKRPIARSPTRKRLNDQVPQMGHVQEQASAPEAATATPNPIKDDAAASSHDDPWSASPTRSRWVGLGRRNAPVFFR